jgi:hypothetical protein
MAPPLCDQVGKPLLGWASLTCTQDTSRSLSHNSAAGMTPGQSTAEARDRQTTGG